MLILEKIRSKMDRNGNTYHAISVENRKTGKRATATVCADNATSALCELFGDWNKVHEQSYTHETTLPIREFNRLTNDVPHARCTGEEIAAWIVSAVGDPR